MNAVDSDRVAAVKGMDREQALAHDVAAYMYNKRIGGYLSSPLMFRDAEHESKLTASPTYSMDPSKAVLFLIKSKSSSSNSLLALGQPLTIRSSQSPALDFRTTYLSANSLDPRQTEVSYQSLDQAGALSQWRILNLNADGDDDTGGQTTTQQPVYWGIPYTIRSDTTGADLGSMDDPFGGDGGNAVARLVPSAIERRSAMCGHQCKAGQWVFIPSSDVYACSDNKRCTLRSGTDVPMAGFKCSPAPVPTRCFDNDGNQVFPTASRCERLCGAFIDPIALLESNEMKLKPISVSNHPRNWYMWLGVAFTLVPFVADLIYVFVKIIILHTRKSK